MTGSSARVLEAALERIAGVDEVGRGALFGPVVAAAVVLGDEAVQQLTAAGVRDSKQLRPAHRVKLAQHIRHLAWDCQVGMASVHEIDRLNILQASLLAMERAIRRLSPRPTLCLIDGKYLVPQLDIPQQAVIKGDQHHCAIASASIIAKVWRDTLIMRLDQHYPGYDLTANKGYGSAKHRQALSQLGRSRQHRQSFRY
ncbi:Ribonuclease HII [Halomicronema hongdechloris C2206]|uniref:Ribonuclease HII n=1 Tax=Halomicronema hongdechloris C2206 TaxID=1641165 RepID=A0A1Z3HI24_9CYAN|nr:ribonuclease HII [Halomicronema hongdechloris]ASC69969.1 Ribonuclease HII [Halomicronema hongdechloris C2206]